MRKFFISLVLALPVVAPASTEFKLSPRSKLEAQISSSELNRIEVNGGDIMEVIGDDAKYSLYWSSDWRNLFIKPKVPVGETLELSLIFFGGLAQDIRFTAGDTTAKTITINVRDDYNPHVHRNDFRSTSDHRLQSEVASMMRAMFEGIKSKYYVTNTKRILNKTLQFQLTQIKAYRHKDLSGAVVEIKNPLKASLKLQEEDFKDLFKGTLAVNLKFTVIAPKSTGLLYIITKGATDDK